MKDVLLIGAGPSCLIAADLLAGKGVKVTVVDRMPSPARKFLMAGRGGLNLTHSEPLERFLPRYRSAAPFLTPFIEAFPPQALREWCHGLSQPTFVGSSGRVFPEAMKASPLLRALLARLDARGVTLRSRLTWTGFGADGGLRFRGMDGGELVLRADAALLGLGGGSWAKLGSSGDWAPILRDAGVDIRDFKPSNCGFHVAWSDLLRERFAGTPLKRVALSLGPAQAAGEAMISDKGLEGGVVYALSAEIRNRIEMDGQATVHLNLRPDLEAADLTARLATRRGKQSMSTFLRKVAGLTPVQISLLREAGPLPATPEALSERLQKLPIKLESPYPMERAISTAGGIALDELDDRLMLKKLPGIFAAGEMLDWEAPTGGYLLQACFSTGIAAARGLLAFLETDSRRDLRP